jgi:hypothetical protein
MHTAEKDLARALSAKRAAFAARHALASQPDGALRVEDAGRR